MFFRKDDEYLILDFVQPLFESHQNLEVLETESTDGKTVLIFQSNREGNEDTRAAVGNH